MLSAGQLCITESVGRLNWQADSQLLSRHQHQPQQHMLLQPFQGFAAHYAKGKGVFGREGGRGALESH